MESFSGLVAELMRGMRLPYLRAISIAAAKRPDLHRKFILRQAFVGKPSERQV